MTHPGDLLSAFLDGETSDEEAAEVLRHVETCGACRVELEDLATARAAVRGLPVLELPDGLAPRTARVTPIRSRRLAAIAAVAAAAVVTVAIGLGSLGTDTVSIDPDVVSSILAAESSLPVAAGANPAVAGYMTDAAGARFTARQTTACLTTDGVVDSTVDVTQADTFTVVADPLGDLTVLTPGTITTGSPSGPLQSTHVEGSGPTIDAAYRITAVTQAELRGRSVHVVTVGRDGVDRVVWTVDDETKAIVGRETLDAGGQIQCRSELLEFQPIDRGVEASVPFQPSAPVSERTYTPVSDSALPAEVGGLAQTAIYQIDDGVVGIYSDGLLTAAVVVVDGVPSETSAGIGRTGQTVNIWQADGTGYGVFGVLPDDVLQGVLADLPSPASSNRVISWFRSLFD